MRRAAGSSLDVRRTAGPPDSRSSARGPERLAASAGCSPLGRDEAAAMDQAANTSVGSSGESRECRLRPAGRTGRRTRGSVGRPSLAAEEWQAEAVGSTTPPPVGNTGVEMTGVGLGWLQGTVKRAKPESIVALVAGVIGSEPEARAGGTRWYLESVTIGPNVLMAWSPRNRPDVAETYFEVRQSALDELGGAASLKLAADLQDAGARMSRADGYYDDRLRHADPGMVAEAFRRGDSLTHIRVIRQYSKSTTGQKGEGAVLDGATVYLGSATSEGMLRVYDKAAESGRPDAGVRWELELRHERAARFVAGALAAADGGIGAYVLACIRGLIDFCDRTGQERGDRAPLLGWCPRSWLMRSGSGWLRRQRWTR